MFSVYSAERKKAKEFEGLSISEKSRITSKEWREMTDDQKKVCGWSLALWQNMKRTWEDITRRWQSTTTHVQQPHQEIESRKPPLVQNRVTTPVRVRPTVIVQIWFEPRKTKKHNNKQEHQENVVDTTTDPDRVIATLELDEKGKHILEVL